MRVRSALYARLEATAPWGLSFTGGVGARFGLVVEGNCWLSTEGQERSVELSAGDCYVLVRGTSYVLSDEAGRPTRPCSEVVRDKVGGVVELGGSGARAVVITGWFTFDEPSARPLMDLVPPLLHVRMEQDRTRLLRETMQLVAVETEERGLGSGVVVSRLADVVFVQVVRTYAASVGGTEVGWLAALSDERIGPAIRAMHREISHPWTVEELAFVACMSRSAFALRFKERVGEPPLAYLTRWRMFRAGCLLRQSDNSISEIAALVGYGSQAAFDKAFKRTMGCAPGSYRRANAGDGPEG